MKFYKGRDFRGMEFVTQTTQIFGHMGSSINDITFGGVSGQRFVTRYTISGNFSIDFHHE